MTQIDGNSFGEVSDPWLRAFVAAADSVSFTAAARRLGVGQPAVSHSIKRLENAVGARLFDRTSSGIVLTPLGEALHGQVSAGFALVDAGVRHAQADIRADRLVTLSVSTALATYWLMPRLASFKERYPDVELRVITQDTDAGVGRDEADLWIPLGLGPWPGLASWDFAEEHLLPVASPGYVERVQPRSLADVDLLHIEERYEARYDWLRWFFEHGLDATDAASGQRSNDYSVVVHAALEGQGVALGWLHIVGPLLADGRLVQVCNETVVTGQPFRIVARRDALRREGVDSLRRWLLSEAADVSPHIP